jgi:hypothetical protein
MDLNYKEALRRMDRRYKKKETEDDLAFKKELQDRVDGDWCWCLHCERAYNKKDIRWDERTALYMCPYEGCSGDAFLDAGWDYASIREIHPDYPLVPEEGKVYPMY